MGALTWYFFTGALLGTLLLTPTSHAQTALETPQQVNDRIRSLSASVHAMPHDYIIGSGDVLEIDVFDVKELSKEVRVSLTGTIGLPLVPVRLRVAGLTELQAEQKIAEVLEANGLVSHPDVSVNVKERKSKPITIVGAVSRPMVYQADRPVTLLEVLAEAGGIANDAGDTVIVTRLAQESPSDSSEPPAIGPEETAPAAAQKNPAAGAVSDSPSLGQTVPAVPGSATKDSASSSTSTDTEPPPLRNTITVNLIELMENGDTANNIALQAGDVVTVPHAGIVYALGAVGRPGGFVLVNDRAQMTTLKVLSLAGGLSRTAKKDKAVIIRRDSQGQQHEVAVDLKKVLERQTEDVQLHPSDILYVPDSAGRQAMYKGLEFGLALATAVALYRIAYH
jgi:polysaccharide export outer membrane protein